MEETLESRIPRAQLRKLMLERRAQIGGEIRSAYDLAIRKAVQEQPPVQAARVLAVYWPIRGEPDLRPLAPGWRGGANLIFSTSRTI